MSSALARKCMVLMVHPSLSHYSLEGEDWGPDEEFGKYCGDGHLGYGDDEERVVSDVWEEGGGRTG